MYQLKAIFNTLEDLKREENKQFNADYAEENYRLARDFLLAYQRNGETFRTYRRELERYLQWLLNVKEESLLKIKRRDIEEYFNFCQNPPANWVNQQQTPRYLRSGLANPNWRPFVQKLTKVKAHCRANFLSESALRIIFAVLGSFYTYLMQEEKIYHNPVALVKQKSSYIHLVNGRVVRRLSPLQWQYVLKAASRLAEQQPDFHNRTLFMVKALYGMYLRISELVATSRWVPQMRHFYRDSEGHWWFKTLGKGNKERDISVSDAMLAAFKDYRRSLGLPDLPHILDDTPLIPNFKRTGGISDPRYIRKLVQNCFDLAYTLMLEDHPENLAAELKLATVHWLRHTGISDDVKIRPREHVRDDAGHSSSAITDRYIDIEKRARYDSAKGKTFVPSGNNT